MKTGPFQHATRVFRPCTCVVLAAVPIVLAGCAGPAVRPTLDRSPIGLPIERAWVVSLTQRWQRAVWGGLMYMPDELVSDVVMAGDRLLSVESQYIEAGLACRLRLVERDSATGRISRQLPVPLDVPDRARQCRLLEIDGRWHVAHAPWTSRSACPGILTPWPAPTETAVPPETVRIDLLPSEMTRYLDDVHCFGTDGRHLLVAVVMPRTAANDTRRWLAAACIDTIQPRLIWAGRSQIRDPIERYRGGVRVGRFDDVVVARASTLMPRGERRCREHYAAFQANTGNVVWSRSAPTGRQPPAFRLVADDKQLYVHTGDTILEAWDLQTGKTIWQRDLKRIVITDGQLHAGQLFTFIGDEYPAPGTPTYAEPVAIPIDGESQIRRMNGRIRVVLPPSFAVLAGWVVSAPDDRLFAWPPMGAGPALEWHCWQLPGGLLPQDAAGTAFTLNPTTLLTHIRGTGTFTLLRLAPPG